MTTPQQLTPLTDDDNVQFQVVEEDEGDQEGTGLTDAEVNDVLNTSLTDAETLTASGDTEMLYPDPGIVKISAEAYGSDRGLREYWTHGEGAAKIRWGTPGDFDRCVTHLEKYVRNPEGLCNEYHVEAVGAPPGKGHSGETESFAVRMGNAPVRRLGAPAEVLDTDNSPVNAIGWEGVLALEGEETGDGREFAHGSLDWATPPLPLMYQYETSHGGDTDKSTNVGNITEVWRDGRKIMGRGTIDLDDPYGMQAARKMKNKYLNGVSIDADSVKNADVELIYAQPDPNATEEEQLLEVMMGAPPEKTIFHRGRVRGATLVNLPAFVGASLELTGDLSMLDEQPLTATGGKVRRYVRDIRGRFDDDPSKGNDEGGGDSNPPRADSTRNIMEYDEDDAPVYEEEVIGDPESDEGADVRRKRRKTVVSPDYDYGVKVITAAASGGKRGYTIEIPELPPLAFFEEPAELPPIGAVWIEPNGHIYGLVGPSGVAHRAFRGKKVTIPMGNVDYTRWMNRPTVVEGRNGEVLKIRTGIITMSCGHLSPYASDDSEERMRHYDNSCSVAALVRVGESRKHKAPWVAGTILPMSTADFQRFQACQLSGDWAPHRERRGWKEFVAALSVPVPGFARSTDVAAVRVDDNSVVTASSVPIKLMEAAYDETIEDPGQNRLELGRIRARIGNSNRQTLAAIRDRINSGAHPLTASAATATPPKEKKKVGCTPCAAKRQRDQRTSAQETGSSTIEGFGGGNAQEIATRSQTNAIANSRGTSRG